MFNSRRWFERTTSCLYPTFVDGEKGRQVWANFEVINKVMWRDTPPWRHWGQMELFVVYYLRYFLPPSHEKGPHQRIHTMCYLYRWAWVILRRKTPPALAVTMIWRTFLPIRQGTRANTQVDAEEAATSQETEGHWPPKGRLGNTNWCKCGARSQLPNRLDCTHLLSGCWCYFRTSEGLAWGWRKPHLCNRVGWLQGCLPPYRAVLRTALCLACQVTRTARVTHSLDPFRTITRTRQACNLNHAHSTYSRLTVPETVRNKGIIGSSTI